MRLSGVTALVATCLFGLVRSDALAVQLDLNEINRLTGILDSDVKKVSAGLLGVSSGLQVQVDAVNIYNKLKSATADANASPAFGEPGSQQVFSALQTVLGTTQTALTDTSAKNTTFDELGPIVLASLYQLRQSSLDFGIAVLGKLSSAESAQAPALASQLVTAFNGAIVSYGGKT